MIQYLLNQLHLTEDRIPNIEAFSEKSRLKPYIQIINDNPNLIEKLGKIYPNRIKDNWDCIVELYRYNIKLSKAIYPYLAILENIIKVKLSDYLKIKYGENFWFNSKLFFSLLELDDFDVDIVNMYFNHKINKVVREKITHLYFEHDSSITKKAIRNKLSKIKKAISILSDAMEFRFKNTNYCFNDFVESKPTLNYWITLLEIKGLYVSSDPNKELDLKPIFLNVEKEDIRTLKTIAQKLDDIRLLRNAISHYNRIICTNITDNLDLWGIYTNIIEMFHLLGCEDVNYIIGDINCCNNGSFEHLYNELSHCLSIR